jgi:ketosteroid isomerase-like protein
MDAEELVRKAYDEAWNSGDLDALVSLVSEDVVIRPSGRIVDLQFGGRREVRTGRHARRRAHHERHRIRRLNEAAEAAGLSLDSG